MGLIYKANVTFFHFDVFAAVEDMQLAKYQEDVKGHYDWHVDFGGKVHSCRKLSLSVQLTDPEEYEGGELQLMTGSKPQVMIKEKGGVVVFPSYMLHRVTPVSKGERMSLVTWMHGLPFR